MNLFYGIKYNLQGILLSLKTPKLLMLGILRFAVTVFFALFLSGLVLYWHDAILSMLWKMPDQGWLLYVWKTVSWLLSIFLAGIAMIISYFAAQIFFCVFIMDYMSRITEKMVLGKEVSVEGSMISFFIYLIRQEIPRAIIPVLISLLIMLLGLLTPLGLIIIVLSSLAAALFLAWDNTDLTPARRMKPFKLRMEFLKKNLLFHIGFGLLFLIPWLNIVFLSFAPVGATLYYLDQEKK